MSFYNPETLSLQSKVSNVFWETRELQNTEGKKNEKQACCSSNEAGDCTGASGHMLLHSSTGPCSSCCHQQPGSAYLWATHCSSFHCLTQSCCHTDKSLRSGIFFSAEGNSILQPQCDFLQNGLVFARAPILRPFVSPKHCQHQLNPATKCMVKNKRRNKQTNKTLLLGLSGCAKQMNRTESLCSFPFIVCTLYKCKAHSGTRQMRGRQFIFLQTREGLPLSHLACTWPFLQENAVLLITSPG